MILLRTAKFNSSKMFAPIWGIVDKPSNLILPHSILEGKPPNLMTVNISGYTVYHIPLMCDFISLLQHSFTNGACP